MRQAVKIKWFKDCSSVEQAKKLRLKLAMQYHPDYGGDLRSMQEINAEWDYVKANPSILAAHGNRAHGRSTSYSRPHEHTRSYSDEWDGPLRPGGYTVKITEVKDNEEKSYVALVFDIEEIRHAGYFAYRPWYKHCIYLKYEEDWQLKNTRKIIRTISESNNGFDGWSDFTRGDVDKFVGKRVGVTLSLDYINGNGFINSRDVFAV